MRPTVFLDRDGVINENRGDYVKCWEEFVFLPGVFAPLRRLAESEFAVVVITNQSAVGRGLISHLKLEAIHERMTQDIEQHGGRVDAVLCCPHLPEDKCDCRKPRPGLLLQAATRLDLDLSRSFLVGDAHSDAEAALKAGCQPVLVLTGLGRAQLAKMPPDLVAQCHIVDDLEAAVQRILGGRTPISEGPAHPLFTSAPMDTRANLW